MIVCLLSETAQLRLKILPSQLLCSLKVVLQLLRKLLLVLQEDVPWAALVITEEHHFVADYVLRGIFSRLHISEDFPSHISFVLVNA